LKVMDPDSRRCVVGKINLRSKQKTPLPGEDISAKTTTYYW